MSLSSSPRVPAEHGTESAPQPDAAPHGDIVALSLFLVPVYVIAAGFYLAQSTGIVDPTGHAVGRDFINLWTAARLVLEGRPEAVFDVDRFHAVQESILGQEFPLHLWSYPPHFLLVVAPLGLVGYLGALALWSGLTSGLYAWAGGGPRRASMVLLALAPATLVNVACGQTGALAAALLFGGLRLMADRPMTAGMLFGLLTVKPQFGLLVPLVLLLERRWTVIASAAATTLGLMALSAAVFGTELWEAYLRQNFAATRSYLERGTGLFMVMAPSPFMAMRMYGAEVWLAYAVQGACAVLVCIGLVVAWRSRANMEYKVAITGMAALLATPYAHNYDMTLVSVAVLAGYGICRKHGCGGGARALLALVWLLPIAIMPLHTLGVVVAPWLLIGFFVWLLVRTDALNT
jgi:alpha-1,2-mannosyltransferase